MASPFMKPSTLHSPTKEQCGPSRRMTKGTLAPNDMQISSPGRPWLGASPMNPNVETKKRRPMLMNSFPTVATNNWWLSNADQNA